MAKHKQQNDGPPVAEQTDADMARSLELANGASQDAAQGTAKKKPNKRESFLKLARRRQPKLGKTCQALANLARKAQYEYTEEEAGKMVNYAKRQCQLVIDAFAGNVSNGQSDPDAI